MSYSSSPKNPDRGKLIFVIGTEPLPATLHPKLFEVVTFVLGTVVTVLLVLFADTGKDDVRGKESEMDCVF